MTAAQVKAARRRIKNDPRYRRNKDPHAQALKMRAKIQAENARKARGANKK